MDVRNCKGCGRLFNYYGGVPLCKACKDKLEEKFQEVKDLSFQKIHHLVWNVKAVEQLSKQGVSVRNANVKWKRTSRV